MKALNLILTALLCTTVPAAAVAQNGYNVYLTAKERSGVPMKEPAESFACSDKIYGVVEVARPGGGTGAHTLYATWRNPSGEDQEVTEYRFQTTDGQARVWVWLKLHRSGEAAIVQFMNPSAGMEEFVGMWELHVRIDDKPVAKKSFEVIC